MRLARAQASARRASEAAASGATPAVIDLITPAPAAADPEDTGEAGPSVMALVSPPTGPAG